MRCVTASEPSSPYVPPETVKGMAEIPFRDYARLGETERAELASVLAGHRGLDDIFAWGRNQSPPVHPADLIKQAAAVS